MCLHSALCNSQKSVAYHISGNSECKPFQLYRLSTASQNFPQDGIAQAPPEKKSRNKNTFSEFVILSKRLNNKKIGDN